jgi:hypothetical protein
MLRRRTMRSFSAPILAPVLFVLCAACSSEDPPPPPPPEPDPATLSCDEHQSRFTACGGDVASGKFKGLMRCVTGTVDPFAGKCPSASSQRTTTLSGSIAFDTQNISYAQFRVETSIATDFSATCIEGKTCRQFEEEYPTTGEGLSADCKAVAATCKCTLAETVLKDATKEPYVVANGRIAIGEQPATEFCLKGKTLTMRDASGALLVYVKE